MINKPIQHYYKFIWPRIILALYLLSFSGCMVGPDFAKPPSQKANQWLDATDPRLKILSDQNEAWWTAFKDPILNQLISQAYHENLSLQVAGVRVLEAHAQLGSAIGNLYPQNQQINGSLTKVQISKRAPQAAFSNLFDYAQTQLGFALSWEIDFWGKFRRAIEAADANVQTVVADYDTVLVSLTADVAQSYITLKTQQKRLEIAKQNVSTQQAGIKIAEIRYNGGTTSERDVEQARTLLANTQASIPTIEISLRQQVNKLSILLGKSPMQMPAFLKLNTDIPTPPLQIAVGIPADLLRRRPDIRHAEMQAAAQSASIGVTKADLYPALSLSGNFGVLSTDVSSFSLGDVFLWKSRTLNFGPTLQWNIFNYGQITNQIRVQDARFQALLLTYQNSVLNAQREVEDSLVAFLRSQERAAALRESTAAAQRSLNLATLQYQEGITDFTTVLTAQQALLNEQDNLASTLGDIANNMVGVYRALGGGWQIREGQAFIPNAIKQQMENRSNWGNLLNVIEPISPDKINTPGLPSPHW